MLFQPLRSQNKTSSDLSHPVHLLHHLTRCKWEHNLETKYFATICHKSNNWDLLFKHQRWLSKYTFLICKFTTVNWICCAWRHRCFTFEYFLNYFHSIFQSALKHSSTLKRKICKKKKTKKQYNIKIKEFYVVIFDWFFLHIFQPQVEFYHLPLMDMPIKQKRMICRPFYIFQFYFNFYITAYSLYCHKKEE